MGSGWGDRAVLSHLKHLLPSKVCLFKHYSMKEIASDDSELRRKRRKLAFLFAGLVFALLVAVAFILRGGVSPSSSHPSIPGLVAPPEPVASVMAQVSQAAKVRSELPETIAELVPLASSGNTSACFELGERYRLGKGCIRDYEEALRWYQAAASDDTALIVKLAKAYEALGQTRLAESSFEKAALKGVREAQLWMAYRHLKDESIEVYDTYAWFNVCAARGDAESASVRDHMDKLYPASVVARGQARALEIARTIEAYESSKSNPERGVLLKRRALAGDRDAQTELGDAYLAGAYVERDLSEALRWYNLAAEAGSIEAAASLARYHEVALKVDYVLSRSYFLKASLAGHVASQFSTAERYRAGINGFDQDTVEAYAWYNVCAASGYKDAIVARDYLEGQMISTQKAAAQKRSREILKEIEAKKAKK